MSKDFSHLDVWIPKHAAKLGLSMEQLSWKVGVSRNAIYRYLQDLDRPSEKTMLSMCRVFKVAFEEGLAQYTPKRNGKPPGRSSETTREVRTRGK